jgi:hypothetical protein
VNRTPSSYVPDGCDAGACESANNEHGQPVAVKPHDNPDANGVPSVAVNPDTDAVYDPGANGCDGVNDNVVPDESNATDPATADPSDPRTTNDDDDTEPGSAARDNDAFTTDTNAEAPAAGDTDDTLNGTAPTTATTST